MASSSSSSSSHPSSYLIVGAGVFGVSSALHLKQKYPRASVTVVDRDEFDASSRVAASWDWNKVVRADYDDVVYCELALEAQDVFRSDSLWKPFYHETGIYWICRSDYADEVMANYTKLRRRADLKSVPVQEARKMYRGLFEEADYTGGVKSVLVNKTSGYAAAGDCLRAITKAVLGLGVKYVVAEVAELKMQDRRCTGVVTAEGRIFAADRVILSTGAYTAKLLELAAAKSGMPNLSAGDRIVAGGITTGLTAPLDDKTYEKYCNMPVAIQGYTAEVGPFIGSLPPTPDRELKWWGPTIFRNWTKVLPSGPSISAPPDTSDYSQWNVSSALKADIARAMRVFYPEHETKQWKPVHYRICWDAFTTSSDFIISPHAAADGLYIATCGSFHGWKFFPVLGKYVVQMLEGRLRPDLAAKWAWDRERPDPKLNPDWPRFDFCHLQEGAVNAKL